MARLLFVAALVLSLAVGSAAPALARPDTPAASTFSVATAGAASSKPVGAARFDPAHPPPSQPTANSVAAPARLTVSAAELEKRRAEAEATMPRLDRALAPAVRTAPIASLTRGTSLAGQTVSLLASAEGIDENVITNPYFPSDGAIASNGASIVYAANDEIQTRAIGNGAITSTWTFSSFFAWAFLNDNDTGVEFSDPRVQWDSFGGHWLMVVDALDPATGQAWECVAASMTADPNLPWWVYALDATVDGSVATSNVSDYPTMGFDNQAVYIATNQFNWYSGQFAYSKLRVFSKSSVEAGATLYWFDFIGLLNADGTLAVAVQPAVNLTAPAAEYLLNTEPLGGSTLSVWEVVNPLSGAPTLLRATIAVSPYTVPIDAAQPGGAQPLDPGDSRAQQVVQWNGILLGAMTTSANLGYGPIDIPRLFTIDAATAGILADNYAGWANVNGFYPSVSVDSAGDTMVVFLCSDAVTYASICEDSRAGTAPLSNPMDSPLGVTPGSYTYVTDDSGGRNRWGDYSAIALDPNGTTFWTLGEYAAYPFNLWGTRVNALTYDPSSTGPTPTPTSTPVVTPTATPAPSFHVYLPFVVSNQGP